MKVCQKIVVLTFSLLCLVSVAQAATIHDFINHVNSEVEQVNQLAAEKKLSKAIERLNMLNRYIEHKANFELDDLIRKEKKQNPSFQLKLNLKLRPELTSSYWQQRYKRIKKAHKNSVEAMQGLSSMRTLDKQDLAWSYLKTTYDAVKSVKDVVEAIGKHDYIDIYKNTKEGFEGFIKNYKKIEETRLQGIKTDLQEVEIKGLTRRAKRSIKVIEPLLSYIKANAEEGDRFGGLLRRIKTIADDIDGGKVVKMVFGDPKYTWNYEPFQKEVEGAISDLKDDYMTCSAFKNHVKQVRESAREDWDKVLINIQSSNDKAQKQEFLKWHDEAWDDFSNVIMSLINAAIDKYCTNSESTLESKQSPKQKEDFQFGGVKKKREKKKTDPERKDEIEEKKERKVEPPPPPPPVKVSKKTGAIDRYWENTIPDSASGKWAAMRNNEIEIRYKVGGRTIGFRRYKDHKLNQPLAETAMDGLGTWHGPSRIFDYDYKSGHSWVKMLSFYRNNMRTGPLVYFDKEGGVTGISYYINDEQVSEIKYKNKAKGDRSLAPVEILDDTKWLKIPNDTIPGKLKSIAKWQEAPWEKFSIPDGSQTFIKSTYSAQKNTGWLFETFYHPNYLMPVGQRTWELKNGTAALTGESLRRGRRTISRRWHPDSGKLESFVVVGFSRIKGSKSQLGVRYGYGTTYGCPGGITCSREEYLVARQKDPGLPALGLIDQFRQMPSTSGPESVPNPPFTDADITQQQLPAGAELWRVKVNSDSIFVQYVVNNRLIAALTWYDHEMTMPRYRTNYAHGQKIMSVSWRKSGVLKSFEFNGRVEKGFNASFDERGKIKKYSYLGQPSKSIQNGKIAYQPFSNIPSENSWKWPGLKAINQPITIPSVEMTPYLNAVLSGKKFAERSVPKAVLRADKKEVGAEDDDYQQKQRSEFFDLAAKIQEKLDAADKAFDKPYWERSELKTTMQPTNPKQESLDVVKSAIKIADRAEYIENRGALYLLIAHKLINYSGRVFAFTAKHDFFSLAVQLVLKSDQTITKNRYLKEKLSDAYADSAAAWRELTRKAQWGDHEYNKVYCDKMVIQQYERALNADPNNKKVRKILEKLKAPKAPVPAQAAKLAEIAPASWNLAQNIRTQIEKEHKQIMQQEAERANYSNIAAMTLNAGKGDVQILRSGSSAWQKVEGDHIVIFMGDIIKTGANAADVVVTFESDNTSLAIKPDSKVEFQDATILVVHHGRNHFRVTKKGSEFIVVTPTCAVGVRGTSFEVNVSDDKTTETYLYEGVVETRTNSKIGYLVAGQKNKVYKDSTEIIQESFDSRRRFEKQWSQLETQLARHQKIRRTASINKSSSSTNTSPYGGVAKTNSRNNQFGTVEFSWSPYESYSFVMVNDWFSYGPHNLIARLPVQLTSSIPVSVNWYKDGQMLSSGDYQIESSSTYFDGQIVTDGEPLYSGNYHVEFVSNGEKLAEGDVTIRTREAISQQAATELYSNAIVTMQQALTLVEQGDLFNAGITASQVIGDLRTVMQSAPNLPDIQAVTEMALAMMSFTEMIHATNENQKERATEWVRRSLGHARRSNKLCEDHQFKISTSQILSALEAEFPEY